MLQMLQKKVAEEGKRDQELFDKYMCYCKTSNSDLTASIKAAEEKLPKVTTGLSEAQSKKDQLQSDLKQHKLDLAEQKSALSRATALRKKDAATYTKEDTEATANIAALTKADAAVTKGLSKSFLQTDAAALIQRIAGDVDMGSDEHDTLMSFLSSDGGDPDSQEILGILRQMKETMVKDQKTARKEEADAVEQFAKLKAAKDKEIAATTKIIQDKTARVGKTGIDIENLKEDLEDTTASYEEDKTFLKNLDKNCNQKKDDYNVVQKTRADEQLALADTIKILNKDSATKVFKTALPKKKGTSFLQIDVTNDDLRHEATQVLASARDKRKIADPRLDFIMLAIKGKKVNFRKVILMIEKMMNVLDKEQDNDNQKKEYCTDKLNKAEEEGKDLKQDILDLGKAIQETASAVATYKEEIKALTSGIKALDKSVTTATKNRKEDNAQYQKTKAADTAAKELIRLARNRLNRFYAPNEYMAPPKMAVVQQNSSVSTSDDADDDEATSFVEVEMETENVGEVEADDQDDASAKPKPPPKAVTAYKKKGKQNSGVIAMLDLIMKDLDKELVEIEKTEKDAQKDYEKFIADSANKRAIDAKSLEEKESMKVEADTLLRKSNLDKKNKEKEAAANAMLQKDLHRECDFLLKNYGYRKKARAGELDSLTKARDVLKGAYSFIQVSSHSTNYLRGTREEDGEEQDE